MSEHTRGPWRPIGAKASIGIYNDSGDPIASLQAPIGSMSRPRRDADARLIAAAPDLLAAAKQARDALSALLTTRDPIVYSDALRALDAAIAKAQP